MRSSPTIFFSSFSVTFLSSGAYVNSSVMTSLDELTFLPIPAYRVSLEKSTKDVIAYSFGGMVLSFLILTPLSEHCLALNSAMRDVWAVDGCLVGSPRR